MALDEEEIKRIAKASADEISKRLEQGRMCAGVGFPSLFRSDIPGPLAKEFRKELRKLPAWKLQEAYVKFSKGEATGIEILDKNPEYALNALKEALWERGKLGETPVAAGVSAPYINEQKKVGDKIVDKFSVGGTNIIVYNAWEPSGVFGEHSTITTFDGEWYGRIGTKRLSPEVEKLPAGSKERIDAVGKAFEEQYEEAYRLIEEAYPESANGKHTMGEIEKYWPYS
jgi:hypothetical protein